MTKIWITKYALTKEIYTGDASISEQTKIASFNFDRSQSCVKGISGRYDYYTPANYTLSEQDAIKLAEEAKKAKIDSLKKQILKLESLQIQITKI